MLIQVSIQNFLSIKERVTLNFTAGRTKQHPSHVVRENHRNGHAVLKSSIIYGPNASGKSNVIKAINFAKQFILGSTKAGSRIFYEKFKLDSDCSKMPSRIEFEIKHKSGNSYAYGFAFNQDMVIEEWLYKINNHIEIPIYNRTPSGFENKINSNTPEDESFIRNTFKGVRDNQLALTVFLGQKTDGVESLGDVLNVIDWFDKCLKVVFPHTVSTVEQSLLHNEELKEMYKKFFRAFNMGISDIEFLKSKLSDSNTIPQYVKEIIHSELTKMNSAWLRNSDGDVYIAEYEDDEIIMSKMQLTHKDCNGFDCSFKMAEESDGTLRLIDLFPMLYDLLKNNSVYIVDEIERSLHANAVTEIFKIFLSSNTESQLIATTHETQLLSQLLFRKDEIWFVDKNENGATEVKSLEQFKIRFDKEIRKDYLQGMFGGVPKYNRYSITSTIKG